MLGKVQGWGLWCLVLAGKRGRGGVDLLTLTFIIKRMMGFGWYGPRRMEWAEIGWGWIGFGLTITKGPYGLFEI